MTAEIPSTEYARCGCGEVAEGSENASVFWHAHEQCRDEAVIDTGSALLQARRGTYLLAVAKEQARKRWQVDTGFSKITLSNRAEAETALRMLLTVYRFGIREGRREVHPERDGR